MSLDLSPETETAVRERAATEGVTVNDLLARTFSVIEQNGQSSADPRDRARTLLRKWRAEDEIPPITANRIQTGPTSAEALFKRWEEEDAKLTDDEVKTEESLWEDFRKGMNASREASGMRPLF